MRIRDGLPDLAYHFRDVCVDPYDVNRVWYTSAPTGTHTATLSLFGRDHAPTGRRWVSPPERGSFPLDHDRACTPLRDEFLACLKAEGNEHVACRALSERYLACRMDKNLMARDAMENIGFGAAPAPNARVVTEGDREREGFVAGTHLGARRGWNPFAAPRSGGGGH